MKQTLTDRAVQALMFKANGGIPNHPTLPVLIYPAAISVTGSDPALVLERTFAANGWPPQWRYGVFDYHHYHTRGHEVLGVHAGHARLMLGGPNGHVVEVKAGDVLLLPAGTGHCNLGASEDFEVVGAYPPGQEGDINRDPATPAQIEQIARLGFPHTDPVLGDQGGVVELWR
ncbi:cupin [Pseudomonas syringae]|nr:cupin [Pseudomonas syringae]MBD8791974.1 cupin [Pseudomonas syringae]MBD8801198.1 cupin [Pseudomonas syringae]MBD8813439.1 cupin [Pseudomonas syringae]